MDPAAAPTDIEKKFMRKHPGWFYWVRHPLFTVLAFVVLVVYAIFLLPNKETAPPLWFYFSISLFLLLVLGYSGNILADRGKPELLKMMVALLLIAVLCWLFYLYSGAQWGRLRKFFFNWKKLEGNWWILRNGLGVTLFLAFISAIGSVLVGLMVAILRAYNSPTLNLFLKAYVDIFRSIPMIVLMVVLFFALPFAGISLGQIEAARSLGLSRWQTIRKIILPQAIPVVIPPLTGNLVAMLKDTAVASVVAAPELLKRARELYTSKTNPTPLVAAALIYLAVLIPLVRAVNMIENRLKR
jgi:polar amino acid transport system permease protein